MNFESRGRQVVTGARRLSSARCERTPRLFVKSRVCARGSRDERRPNRPRSGRRHESGSAPLEKNLVKAVELYHLAAERRAAGDLEAGIDPGVVLFLELERSESASSRLCSTLSNS